MDPSTAPTKAFALGRSVPILRGERLSWEYPLHLPNQKVGCTRLGLGCTSTLRHCENGTREPKNLALLMRQVYNLSKPFLGPTWVEGESINCQGLGFSKRTVWSPHVSPLLEVAEVPLGSTSEVSVTILLVLNFC